jgi:hypothetical protein
MHYSTIRIAQEENIIVLLNAISTDILVHCRITVLETEKFFSFENLLTTCVSISQLNYEI